MEPAGVEFAAYIPGEGFKPCPDLRSANHEAVDFLWKLYAGTVGPVWPPKMEMMGVYAKVNRSPGHGEHWTPLRLAYEVPGTRMERYPCPNDECEHLQRFCTYCGGQGFVDQYGEPWGGDPGVSLTVRWGFDPVPDDGRPAISPEAREGMRNALMITGAAVLVILAIWAEVFGMPH